MKHQQVRWKRDDARFFTWAELRQVGAVWGHDNQWLKEFSWSPSDDEDLDWQVLSSTPQGLIARCVKATL